MSASQKKPWKKFIRRDTLQGGGSGKVGKPTFRGEAAYVRRLRRTEVIVLYLSGKLKMEIGAVDRLLEAMLELRDVEPAKPSPESGTQVQGDAVPVPLEGSPVGETEREG